MLCLRENMQVSLALRGSKGPFVKRDPTTRTKVVELFRLENKDSFFRSSMSPAHDHDLESQDAYVNALNVRVVLELSFPWNTPGQSVAGRAFAAKIIDLAE